jgi:hypothetical protein
MKKIKLWWLKLTYWVDMYLGCWMVNERKAPLFIKDMTKRKMEIDKIEEELKSNC